MSIEIFGQRWYFKKMAILNWQIDENFKKHPTSMDESIQQECLKEAIKQIALTNDIFYPIQLQKQYTQKIRNRQINQNIFDDYEAQHYKYPQIVKQKLKEHYKFNLVYNHVFENELLQEIKQIYPWQCINKFIIQNQSDFYRRSYNKDIYLQKDKNSNKYIIKKDDYIENLVDQDGFF